MPTEQLRFDGEVAMITGAGGKGMGSAHAELLASRGAKVVLYDLFEEPALEVVNRITANGGSAIAVIGSVSNRADCERAVRTTIEKFGRISILVNNAGIDIKGSFEDFSDENFHKTISVNLTGSWYMSKLVWPLMKKQNYGKIIMVSSTSIYGMADNSAYMASKGALLGLTKSLATEGEAFNIQVNAIGPIAQTPMARLMNPTGSEEDPQLEAMIPPSGVSPVLAWLVHRDCKLSGEFITAFGSRFARMFMAETDTAGAVDLQGHTIENVRDNMEKVVKNDQLFVPKSVFDTMERYYANAPKRFV